MAELLHIDALIRLPRILANLDEGQRREVAELRGLPIDEDYLRQQILGASFLWLVERDNFCAIIGLQSITPFAYNTWVVSTRGLRENLRTFLREVQKFRCWVKEKLPPLRFLATATIPEGFTPGLVLARHIGFEGSQTFLSREI